MVLPTFPPDDYDDEDEEDEENTGLDERISNTTKTETSSGTPSDKNNEVEDASNAKTPTLYTVRFSAAVDNIVMALAGQSIFFLAFQYVQINKENNYEKSNKTIF